MPSGFTYKLCEGEQSFPEFVWDCVRAMGAFIHMRDDGGNASLRLPEKDFCDRGSKEKVEERRAALRKEDRELRELKAKTPEQIEIDFENYKEKQIAEYEESLAKVTPIRNRLEAMRSQVMDWQAPSIEHEGLKEFMLKQLEETIKWDGQPHPRERPTFPATAAEWHQEEIRHQERYVARTKELLEEEINSPDLTQDHIDWIKALIDSVPPPPGRFAE